MDNQNDGLWRGGPWEQPSPVFPTPPPVCIPAADRTRRPVLRVRRKRRKWPWFVGILALISVICLSVVALEGRVFSRLPIQDYFPSAGDEWRYEDTEEHSTEPPSIPRAGTGTGVTLSLLPALGETLDYIQIYERTAPSTVSIESDMGPGYSSGTGVVLTRDGYLITNAHVVAGARSVQVLLHDNRTLSASLVGFDAVEDLAVLKVEAEDLTPAQFGDSNALRIGEPVAALGDSLGYRATFTDGIVSSLYREVEVDDVNMVLIQTSAAINYGNSGGPLLNQYGQVVGINTVKIVSEDGSAEGLGFAIPSRRVKYVADRLIAGEEVKAGVFGFMVYTAPQKGGGLELRSVERSSDAWAKGLRSGDILIEANGVPITGFQDLTQLKLGLGAGDSVSLTYLRNGEQYTVDVELIEA
ncbi:trypsin-like peptidase domain-containing protein [Oscillospiraceae bacterium 44-34]